MGAGRRADASLPEVSTRPDRPPSGRRLRLDDDLDRPARAVVEGGEGVGESPNGNSWVMTSRTRIRPCSTSGMTRRISPADAREPTSSSSSSTSRCMAISTPAVGMPTAAQRPPRRSIAECPLDRSRARRRTRARRRRRGRRSSRGRRRRGRPRSRRRSRSPSRRPSRAASAALDDDHPAGARGSAPRRRRAGRSRRRR